ncbi:MAG: hypothetical protein AAF333_06020 [Planctomycetota bacterium]
MKREFYVGYLPLPARMKRGLLILVPMLLIAVVVVGAVLPTKQNDPGTGAWDLDGVTEYTGIVRTEPYPAVLVPADSGGYDTVLLASQIKTGVQERAADFEGAWVTVRGNLAERDGRRLLTLLDGDTAVQPVEAAGSFAPAEPESQGRFQLTGQIIDPKCYLGAMKPGEGKIHKACATLCIKGGIPPMFMTENRGGERALYLLTDASGDAVFNPIEQYIADPITAEGEIETHGDLSWFKIDPLTIQRLR